MVRICRQLNTTNNISFSRCNKQFTGSKQSKHACTGLSQTDVKYYAMPQKPHQLKNSRQANHTRTEYCPRVCNKSCQKKTPHTQDADNTHIFFTGIKLFLFQTVLTVIILKLKRPAWQCIFKPSKHPQKIQGIILKMSLDHTAGQRRWDPTLFGKCTLYAVTNFSELHWALSPHRSGCFAETSPSYFCLGINLLQGYGSCVIWQGHKQRKQQTAEKTLRH